MVYIKYRKNLACPRASLFSVSRALQLVWIKCFFKSEVGYCTSVSRMFGVMFNYQKYFQITFVSRHSAVHRLRQE